MANNPKLRAGKGAKATILTKMIRPNNVAIPHEKHRSTIIITDRIEENGKHRFLFHFDGADETQLLNGSIRYVTIVSEGEPSLFFDVIESNNNNTTNNNSNNNNTTNSNGKKFVEPKISWAKSRARKLLYTDVKQEKIPLDAKVNGQRTTNNNDVYLMHEEYLMWDYKKFSGRLAGVRKIIKRKNTRADEDRAAFDKFVENNPVSYFSHKGYIQWQGSESQRLLKKDIRDGTINGYTKEKYKYHKMQFWLSRQEYYDEFPLHVFRSKIRQEIRTKKYLHTLKVMGKKETYKYN